MSKNLQYLWNGTRWHWHDNMTTRLLWRTNRKSYTRFRFIPKSMTLDDLERPRRTLAEKSFYGAHPKNLNEDRPIPSAAKCRSMIQVSRNKVCVNIRLYSPHYYTVIRSPSSAFQWSQNAWPWMTSKRNSKCFVLALAPDASTSTRLPCLAYINVLLLTYYKIRYVSKFTGHRAVLPAMAQFSCNISYLCNQYLTRQK